MSAIDSEVRDGKDWMGPKGPWPDLSHIPDDAPPLGGAGPTPTQPPNYKYDPNCIEGPPADLDWKPHPPLVDLSGVPDTAPSLGGLTHESPHATDEFPSIFDLYNP